MRKPLLAHRGSNGKLQFGRSAVLSCRMTYLQPPLALVQVSQQACAALRKSQLDPCGYSRQRQTPMSHTTQGPIGDQRLHAVRLGRNLCARWKAHHFRYLANLAAGHGFAINHMDVVTAFLNPHVDDPELYMKIPKGWDSRNGGAGNMQSTSYPRNLTFRGRAP